MARIPSAPNISDGQCSTSQGADYYYSVSDNGSTYDLNFF